MLRVEKLSRRRFLALTGAAGSGLLLGVTAAGRLAAAEGSEVSPFAPDVFLRIAPDGTATIMVSRSEMGQGVRTGLPMIVAEELELPWTAVRLEQADGAADERYGSQLTGGSYSVRVLYDRLRRAGAVAREMLVSAAAQQWRVDRSECRAELGEVIHRTSGRRLGYDELAARAARLPVADLQQVRLKNPSEFRLLGTRVARVDQRDHLHGTAVYGSDVELPGMLVAAVARCPCYGGRLAKLDPRAAESVAGVRRIVQFEGREEPFYLAAGVAVVADHTWAALEGVRRLEISWDPGARGGESTAGLAARLGELVEEPAEVVHREGDLVGALDRAVKTVEATYELPFLAHAPMEPMTCTVRVGKESCEVWSPTQNPQAVQRVLAGLLEIPPEAVTVHVTLLGGGFGRRLYPDTELEAALIARRLGAPVKLFWTREDDLRHDRYRPASLHRLRGGLNAAGRPTAWHWRILNTHTNRFLPEDIPARAIPNIQVEYRHVSWILPRGAWRATTNSQNPFVVQSFLDELAAAGGRDPLDLRLELLRARRDPVGEDESGYDGERMIQVLERAAAAARWGGPKPAGVGRGLAFQAAYGSYVAQVAEVEVVRGRPRVKRLVCAVDCGQVINPDLVEAQVEGAVAFALSAALRQRITVEGGRVVEGNFDDFPLLTIDQMPRIETHILANHQPPGGMGEVGLPPLAPAVANALFDLTGTRIRRLPIGRLG